MKSDIFNERDEKLEANISEWFSLLLILLTHNLNVKDLNKITFMEVPLLQKIESMEDEIS